jgi:hypothetical protein
VVNDVATGDRPRFRRALEQGRGFGAAIAQAVGFFLAASAGLAVQIRNTQN